MNNTITLPTMISVKQASAQFGLTPYFLRSLCHDGKNPLHQSFKESLAAER